MRCAMLVLSPVCSVCPPTRSARSLRSLARAPIRSLRSLPVSFGFVWGVCLLVAVRRLRLRPRVCPLVRLRAKSPNNAAVGAQARSWLRSATCSKKRSFLSCADGALPGAAQGMYHSRLGVSTCRTKEKGNAEKRFLISDPCTTV